MAGKRRKFHELGAHNDIKYRGPLSYQVFQVLGWCCIALTFAVILMKAGIKLSATHNTEVFNRLTSVRDFLSYVASMSLPFLLIANFSRILSNEEGYKKQLIRNGAIMGSIAVVVIFFVYRYVIGAIAVISKEPAQAMPAITRLFRKINPTGFLAFNVFVDLFLCTLFMYFLDHRPKRFFTGKKVILFRLFALLPIAYEVCSIFLKAWSAKGEIQLPLWSFPLLTVKPPITFAVFIILAVFVKTRELRYCWHGKRTHQEYQEFLKTNRNSLHFSVFLSILLVVAGVIDLMILVFMLAKDNSALLTQPETVQITETYIALSVPYAIGFGGAFPIMFTAPIVLLYSYNKIPKNKMISMVIPIVGITVILLIIIQGVYQLLHVSGIRIDLNGIADTLDTISALLTAQ